MTRVQGSISMCQIGFLLEAGTRSRFPTMSSRCQPCEEKRMEACAWPASDLRFDFAARAPPDAEDDLADPDAIYARFSVSLARVSPGSSLQLVDHIKKKLLLGMLTASDQQLHRVVFSQDTVLLEYYWNTAADVAQVKHEHF
jgi:hypothetical protein